jgi:hypothetical protein
MTDHRSLRCLLLRFPQCSWSLNGLQFVPFPLLLHPCTSCFVFPLFFPLSFRSFSFSLIQLVRQLGPRAVTNRRSSPRSFPHLGYKQGAPTTQQGPFDPSTMCLMLKVIGYDISKISTYFHQTSQYNKDFKTEMPIGATLCRDLKTAHTTAKKYAGRHGCISAKSTARWLE